MLLQIQTRSFLGSCVMEKKRKQGSLKHTGGVALIRATDTMGHPARCYHPSHAEEKQCFQRASCVSGAKLLWKSTKTPAACPPLLATLKSRS